MEHMCGVATSIRVPVDRTDGSKKTWSSDLIKLEEPDGVIVQVDVWLTFEYEAVWNCQLIVVDSKGESELIIHQKLWCENADDQERFSTEVSSSMQTFSTGYPCFMVTIFDPPLNREYFVLCLKISPLVERVVGRSRKRKMEENLKNEFTNARYADAVIKVGDQTIKVIKAMLCIHSAIFASMFEHNFEEKKTNEIVIPNADVETVEAMLYFVYSGKVNDIDKLASRLLLLADQYQLEDLTEMCVEALSFNFTMKNVIERLRLLTLPDHLTAFKTKLFAFTRKNYKKIRQLPDWSQFIREHSPILDELMAASFCSD